MASSSATAPKEKPLSFMERLSPETYIYRPSQAADADSSSSSSDGSPKLILLASWTDASENHIVKYISKYQEIFPRAQIALIRSSTATFFKPARMVQGAENLIPVIKSVFHTGLLPSSQPELLIHIFSNGGSANVASLHEAYAAAAAEGEDKRLPLHVTVIDSAPSEVAAARLVAFVQVGMSSIVKILTAPILWLVAASWSLLVSAGVLTNWMAKWGEAHNNREQNNELRRVYIYSEEDRIVDFGSIERHAQKAEQLGFHVQREKYDGSAHVSHSRKDEVRYWEIVRKVWYGY